MIFNYRNSYNFLRDLSETLSEEYEMEIKKIIKDLPEIQVIECATAILNNKIIDQDDIYIIIKASEDDLPLNGIVEAKNKLEKYEKLIKEKEDGTDIYNLFIAFDMKENNKYFKSIYNKNNMPRQGWIFNISAKGYNDYRKLLLTLVPELANMKACFRVLSPEYYDNSLDDVIQIYFTSEFNFASLTNKAKEMLLDNINTQKYRFIMGRISVIFQNFFSTKFIDTDGSISSIISEVYPTSLRNLTSFDILNFHETILEKYNASKDITMYMQEYLTGFFGHVGKNYYYMYVISDEDVETVKEFSAVKDNEDINAIYEFTEYKNDKLPYTYKALIVHKNFNEEVVREMIRNNITYHQIEPLKEEGCIRTLDHLDRQNVS